MNDEQNEPPENADAHGQQVEGAMEESDGGKKVQAEEPAEIKESSGDSKGSPEMNKHSAKAEKKRREKLEKDREKERKKAEWEQKFRQILHDQFHGILDEDKVIYTVIFFVGAIVVSMFSLFGSGETWPLTATEIVTMILFLGFLFLMLFAMIPSVKEYMFGSMKEWWRKIIISLIAFGVSAIINAILFISLQPDRVPIVFLSHETLFPTIFILIFIGWNVIQIHFIKDGLKDVSENIQEKLVSAESDLAKKRTLAVVFMVLGQAIPILIHIFTVWGFWGDFTTYETPGNPTPAELTNLNTFIAWSVIMLIVILITNYWQIRLYKRSAENDTPNVFSNMLYILLWIIFWFRSFGFINAFLSSTSSGSDIFLIIGNVFLLAFTSIMVLRGLAERVKKTQFISEDAVPFLVYALTTMYVAGQVIMIIWGFGTRDQVNMLNNALILITSLIYYFWYSEYILQRKGYIPRDILTVEEANKAFDEFGNAVLERHPEDRHFVKDLTKQIMKKYRIRKIEYTLPDLTSEDTNEEEAEQKAAEDGKEEPKSSEFDLDEEEDSSPKENQEVRKTVEFDDEDEIALSVDEEISKKSEEEAIEFSDEDEIKKAIDDEIETRSKNN